MKRRANGMGSVVKLRKKDKRGKVRLSRNWFIFYRVDGKLVREPTHSESKMVAERLLQRRLGEVGLGRTPDHSVKALTYNQIREAWLARAKERKSGALYKLTDGTETVSGLSNLDRFFGGMRAVNIKPETIERYKAARRAAGASDPTIRRNLVILRSMLNLARKQGKLDLHHVPHFQMPEDSEPAGQYLAPETFVKLLAVLPKRLHPFFNFLYYTGCRIGAAKQITWNMVNKDATEIKLPAEIMKARQPLTIVLAGPGLEQVAVLLRKMFHKNNEPVFYIVNYRVEWQKACHKLGLGVRDKNRCFSGLRIHDLRCSAAVNLIEAGVDRDLVMEIGAWKTDAMLTRYNIINTDRMRAAMERGGQYVASRMQSVGRGQS
jgi:integrase